VTATALDTSFVRGLEATLRAAGGRATSSNGSILASWTAPVEPEDALRLVSTAAGKRVYWEVAADGTACAGSGEAWQAEGTGATRFATLRAAWQQTLATAVIRCDPAYPRPAPLAFAGFRFNPEGRSDPAWRDFPDGLLYLPRLLYMRRGARAWLTVNACLAPGASLDAELPVLLADLDRSAAPEAAGEPQPAVRAEERVRRDRWERAAAALIDAIGAGDVEKVVLARQVLLRSEGGDFDVFAALRRLRERYAGCSLFAAFRGESCFLGASPERLVRLDGAEVSVDCLAGSAERGATEAEDEAIARRLLDDAKERHEHDLVRRDLVEALSPVCDGLRVAEEPLVKRLANVQHLYRPVTGRARPGTDALDLVERLHPTAATGGLPRRSALSLIRTFEPADRGWYAGPVGWLDSVGGGEFAVAIRSGLVRGGAALLYAGCGIVAGSDPAREYEEASIKLEAMRWALSS